MTLLMGKDILVRNTDKLVHLTGNCGVSEMCNCCFCTLSQHYRRDSEQKDKGPDLANPGLLNNLKSNSRQNYISETKAIKL